MKEVPFGLLGQGKTVAETIADFKNSYAEMREQCTAEAMECPQLEFEFRYDVPSFLHTMHMLSRLRGWSASQESTKNSWDTTSAECAPPASAQCARWKIASTAWGWK